MANTRTAYNGTRPLSLWLSLSLIMKYDMIADALSISRSEAIRRSLERDVDLLLANEVPNALAERKRQQEELKTFAKTAR
jgi:hypothetical protein